jgi:hypothetical protein
MLAAAAAFRAAGSPTAAANVVGALLVRWHYIALLAPMALMILEWRRARAALQIVLFAAIVFAALQALADTRIRMIRHDSPVPISELSRNDPVRRRFGMLHGISSMLLVLQMITAAAAVVMTDGKAKEPDPVPPPAHPQPD